MKKEVSVILSVFLLLLCVCGFSGCTAKEYSTEDFIYRIGNKAIITGLTEEGQKKEVLVIPEKIGKREVGFRRTWARIPSIKSDVVKKIFISYKIDFFDWDLRGCSNLEKAIIVCGGAADYSIYNNEFKYVVASYSYSYYEYINGQRYDEGKAKNVFLANISYMYNCDNEGRYGYYWIDDYDYGSKIEFIPAEPTREGYIFGGWHKEPECLTEWNFDTDTLPEEKKITTEEGEEVVQYQETRLYAKWIEN